MLKLSNCALCYLPLLLIFTACGGSSSDSNSTTVISPTTPPPINTTDPVFTLGISDAVVDSAVIVSIHLDSITLIPVDQADASDIVIEEFTDESNQVIETIQVNLLDYTGSEQLKIIDEVLNIMVPTGNYQMELQVLDQGSFVMLENDETEYALKVPSSRLRLGEFTVTESAEQIGETPAYTIEFDLQKSLVQRGNNPSKNGFILKPHGVRVASQSGGINGNISPENTNLGSCRVYLYTDSPEMLADLYDSEDEDFQGEIPQATAPFSSVKVNDDSSYEFAFLPAGNYTLALYCGSEEDDNIQFDGIVIPTPEGSVSQVNVEIGQSTQVDF